MSEPTLCILWLPDEQVWAVWDAILNCVIEKFRHIADAGWYVQSQERAA